MKVTQLKQIRRNLDELSTDVFTIREFKCSAQRHLNEAQRITDPDDFNRAIKDTIILSDAVSSTIMTLDGVEPYIDNAISVLAVVKDLLKQEAQR